MIIQLSTGTSIQISKEKAESVKQAIKRGVEYIEIDDMLIKTSAIMSVENPAHRSYYPSFTELGLPSATNEISDLRPEETIERIQAIKQRLLNK